MRPLWSRGSFLNRALERLAVARQQPTGNRNHGSGLQPRSAISERRRSDQWDRILDRNVVVLHHALSIGGTPPADCEAGHGSVRPSSLRYDVGAYAVRWPRAGQAHSGEDGVRPGYSSRTTSYVEAKPTVIAVAWLHRRCLPKPRWKACCTVNHNIHCPAARSVARWNVVPRGHPVPPLAGAAPRRAPPSATDTTLQRRP